MLGLISSLVAIAVGLAGFSSGARTRGLAGSPPGSRLRALGGLAIALIVVAALTGKVPWHPLTVILGFLLAWLLGMVTAVIASLTVPGMGRWRRYLFVAPMAFLAALMAIAGDVPLALPAIFLLPATGRMPWLDRRLGLGARALLLVASLFLLGTGISAAESLPAFPGGMQAVLRLGGAAAFSYAGALLINILIQFPGRIFDRFRLRTRLAVSYILVAAVPVVLIAVFLIAGAYLLMGSYRAATAKRLLAPGGDVRRAVEALVADPALAEALALEGTVRTDALDRLARARLPGGGSYLLAARRELADTTRFVLRFAPRERVPAEVAALAEPLPARPADAMVYAGDRIYSTTAVSRVSADHEIIARAFSLLDSQRLRDVARAISTEIRLVTVDSVEATAGTGGVTISIGEHEETGAPLTVLASEPAAGASYFGAQLIEGWRIIPDGTHEEHSALLAVRAPLSRLIAVILDTTSNEFNVAVLVGLAVIGGLFLLVEAAAFLTGSTIARRINQAVATLNEGTRRLAEDDLEHRIDLERGDELGELATSFNIMAQGLEERRRLAIEREVIHRELLVAQSIQRRLLPAQVPAFPGLDVAGTSIPSREVGGDAYDVLRWGDGLLVSVADVAGKGIPAAILMSNLHAGLRGQLHRSTSPSQVLGELNELVLASTDPGRFITLALALVEPGVDRLVYANAGHSPPIIRRASGEIQSLEISGLLLGVMPGATYEETQVALAPGDTLVLYTDGVIEAMNSKGDFFGEERLTDLLRRSDGLDAAAVRDRIVSEVGRFAGEESPNDDLTVVVVRRT